MSVTAARTDTDHVVVHVVEDRPLLSLPAPPELTLPTGGTGLQITIACDRRSVLGWMHHIGGTLASCLAQTIWDAAPDELADAGYTRDEWVETFTATHADQRHQWRTRPV